MYPTLTHIALHVQDVATSVAFYEDYCGLRVVQERAAGVAWLAEAGRDVAFVIVLVPGGRARSLDRRHVSHLGFACGNRDEVDAVAARARTAGRLVWEPRQEPPPVGYHCGITDPDGNFVEFSYGQPLGPGAEVPARG